MKEEYKVFFELILILFTIIANALMIFAICKCCPGEGLWRHLFGLIMGCAVAVVDVIIMLSARKIYKAIYD